MKDSLGKHQISSPEAPTNRDNIFLAWTPPRVGPPPQTASPGTDSPARPSFLPVEAQALSCVPILTNKKTPIRTVRFPLLKVPKRRSDARFKLGVFSRGKPASSSRKSWTTPFDKLRLTFAITSLAITSLPALPPMSPISHQASTDKIPWSLKF